MTAAQKKARAVFMKAIQYRKSHPGVSLKQAFAYAKTGKATVAGSVKPKKKATPKKKAPTKMKAATKRKTVSRPAHKDTKSHNVNIRVVSGVGRKKFGKNYVNKVKSINNVLPALGVWTKTIESVQSELKQKGLTAADKNKLRKELRGAKQVLSALKKMI